MPAIETNIWLTLRARLESLPLDLPIAWPNEDFKPEPKQTYLRATWIPNINRRLFVTSTSPHERLSLLQVDVFSDLNQNAAVGYEIAGQIAAHFPSDLKLDSLGLNCRVQKAPDVAQALPQETRWMVPVTVNVVTYA